jgi:hypothetical protein
MKEKALVYSLASDDAIRLWVQMWFADPGGQRPSRLHALLAFESWDQEPTWYFDADYQGADWRADPLVLTISGYRSPWGEWSEVGTIGISSEGRGERRRGLIELAYQDDEMEVRNYFEEFDKHIRMHWIGTIRDKWEADFDERVARIPPRPPLQRPSPPSVESIKKTGETRVVAHRTVRPLGRRGRIGYLEEDKKRLLKAFLEVQGRQSQRVFCDVHQLSPSTLRGWLREAEAGAEWTLNL